MHRLPLTSMSTPRPCIPILGFGTGTKHFNRDVFKGVDTNDEALPLSQEVVAAVTSALDCGLTHIDAAEMYGTEREVGVALRTFLARPGASRQQLFITTKLFKGLADVPKAVPACLSRLGLDQVDLLLVHSPFTPDLDYRKVWADMEACVDRGLARSIGVSNYTAQQLTELMSYARIKPSMNQVEAHPHLQQPELREVCRHHGVVVSAYSPQAPLTLKEVPAGALPLRELLQRLAETHSVTPGQVLLRWSIQQGYVPITTTSSPQRMREYLAAAQAGPPPAPAGPPELAGGQQGGLHAAFSLSQDEVDEISRLGAEHKLRLYWAKEYEALGL
ncbi:NADP-dependent oxidoreductase domain-containing protein [Haematococcus lacustris]